jgi:hypothetical protein
VKRNGRASARPGDTSRDRPVGGNAPNG